MALHNFQVSIGSVTNGERLEELEPLDLGRCRTVSEIVEGMSRCSFGARMLGEVSATLCQWARATRRPEIVYDGRSDSPLGTLLCGMVERGWFSRVSTPHEFAARSDRRCNVLVVGGFSERYEEFLWPGGDHGPERCVFVNPWDLSAPNLVQDGYYPDVLFADPRYILPLLSRTMDERLNGRACTASEFLDGLEPYGGVAAEVFHGARAFHAMVSDRDCTVFFTVSGAMTIAKMGLVICDMIDHGMVHGMSTTGALMAHGLVESLGLKHYKHNPEHSDALLASKRINRVTDTLEPEENLDHVEQVLGSILQGHDGSKVISPRILNRMIGEHLHRHYPRDRGILKSAYERDVPVFVPAFVDSEIGNDVYVQNRKRRCKNLAPIQMDLELDTQHLIDMATNAKRAGIFTIGGGVPRNNIQNVAPLIEITNERLGLKLPASMFFYGCRICPDRPHYGHLSGCTYSEGMSWRKFDPAGLMAEVHADATQVWPFLVKYVLEKGAVKSAPSLPA